MRSDGAQRLVGRPELLKRGGDLGFSHIVVSKKSYQFSAWIWYEVDERWCNATMRPSSTATSQSAAGVPACTCRASPLDSNDEGALGLNRHLLVYIYNKAFRSWSIDEGSCDRAPSGDEYE